MRFLVDYKNHGLWRTYGQVEADSPEAAVAHAREGLRRLEFDDTECVATLPKQYVVTVTQHFVVEATSADAAADKVKGTRISDEGGAQFTVKLRPDAEESTL